MTKNKKNVILVLGMLGLIFSSYLIFQTIRDIKKGSSALLSQREKTILLEKKIKALEEINKNYKNDKEKLEKIDSLFVKADEPISFIKFINFLRQTEESCQVSINISPPSLQKKDSVPYLSFQVSGEGRFIGVMRFLEKIENSPYLIEISRLSLRRVIPKEKALPKKLGFNLSLKVYSFPK